MMQTSDSTNTDKSVFFICIALMIMSLTVFWQLTGSGFIHFDDNVYITENYMVRTGISIENIKWAFTTTLAEFWHPVVWLSHMIVTHFFGLSPEWHHLVNIFFHTLNVVLLFYILFKMTNSVWRSAMVAFLFAFHPLNIQPVAWISARKDILSTFFWFLTLWGYIHYVENPYPRRYVLMLSFFILGLMSKPMLITLPLTLLLFDYWPLNRFRNSSKNSLRYFLGKAVREKIPLFILSIFFTLITFHAQKTVSLFDRGKIWLQVANAANAYSFYLFKLFYPVKLSIYYPYPSSISIVGVVISLSVLVIFTVLFIFKTNRPYLATGWLWYGITLFPVSGIVRVGTQAVADRYAYIPLIGIFIIISWSVSDCFIKWKLGKKWIIAIVTISISLLLSANIRQLSYWSDPVSLYARSLEITENNYRVHGNMGIALFDKGRIDEAIWHFSETLRIKQDDVNAHINLGTALERKGRLNDAVAHYYAATTIDLCNPSGFFNLGVALMKSGQNDEAIKSFREALRIKPAYPEALIQNALACCNLKKFSTARTLIEKAISYEPENAITRCNAGNIYRELGDWINAKIQWETAVKLDPDYFQAYLHLGNYYQIIKNSQTAIRYYKMALNLDPLNAEAHYNIALSYEADGNHELAAVHFLRFTEVSGPEYKELVEKIKKKELMNQ